MPSVGEHDLQSARVEPDIGNADIFRDIGDVDQALAICRIAACGHLAVVAQPQRGQLALGAVRPHELQPLWLETIVFDAAHVSYSPAIRGLRGNG